MFVKNGFKTAGKNLYNFISNGDQAVFVRDVFRPAQLGKLTKDNMGSNKLVIKKKHLPDFKFKECDEKLNEMLKKHQAEFDK